MYEDIEWFPIKTLMKEKAGKMFEKAKNHPKRELTQLITIPMTMDSAPKYLDISCEDGMQRYRQERCFSVIGDALRAEYEK